MFNNYLELVPSEIEKEVRNLYLGLCELLSHFWKCFPANNPSTEQKLIKMHEALHRYQAARLKPFEVSFWVEFGYCDANFM